MAKAMLAVALGCPLLAAAQAPTPPPKPEDLTDLPIEDLMKISITDVLKTPMPLMQVPAAYFVLTQDDIRRCGAVNLPEALRQVPGVEVLRWSSFYYIVSIRGFGSYESNKLLVLVDGRQIYTPFQNGVYWEIEDMLLEDIDRIEVIRGPGGSLWGANAVDGVINIITKKASQTQGGQVVQTVGTFEHNDSSFRYGGSLGANDKFRVYGKYESNAASQTADGSSNGDANNLSLAGFRSDWDLGDHQSLVLEGELGRYFLPESQTVSTVTAPYSFNATNVDSITTSHLLAKWEMESASGAKTSAQAFYDLVDYPFTDESSTGTTYDLQLDHRSPYSKAQSISTGLEYRYQVNDTTPGPIEFVTPYIRRDTVASGYAQDDFSLTSLLHLTAGIKVEHNSYTGFEFEPNVRAAYTPDDRHTLWVAVGRAVRTPSQTEANIFTLDSVNAPTSSGSPPVATANIGNPNLGSEHLISNELGCRAQVNSRTSFDLATFYNIYDNLVYLAPGAPFNSSQFGAPIVIDPSYYRNGDHGQTYGYEASGKLKPAKTLGLDLTFSAIQSTHFAEGTQLNTPPYQASAHLSWTPSATWESDIMYHWYDAIFDQGVPSYTKLDVRVAWKPTDRLEFSLTGYDLLAARHAEFGSVIDPTSGQFFGDAYIPRSVLFKVSYRF